MDALSNALIGEIATAAGEGNLIKAGTWALFFVVIWMEVRGMKKEIRNLSKTVAAGFQAGEDRFEKIEKQQMAFEHRLTMLEPKNKE